MRRPASTQLVGLLLVAMLASSALAARGGRGRGLARGRGGGGGGAARGGSRGGRAAPARVWSDKQWDHKAADAGTRDKPAGKGRSRAAKRTALYDELRAYDETWQPLLNAEWQAEQTSIVEQIEQWPQKKLINEGWLLKDLEAMRITDFFGEPVVKCSLRAPMGGRQPSSSPSASKFSPVRLPLPFHRFAAGDVVTLCKGDEPLLPAWLERDDPPPQTNKQRGAAKGEADEAIEGVILQRTATALHVIVRSLPAELDPAIINTNGRPKHRRSSAAHPFCLSRGTSAVPYERCSAAVGRVADPELPEETLSSELRRLVAGSLARRGSSSSGGGASRKTTTRVDEALLESAEMPPAFLGKKSLATAAAKAALKVAMESSKQELNPSQLSTIRQALRKRVSLIQGPAGTGKTKTATLLVCATIALHKAAAQQQQQQQQQVAGGGTPPVLAVAASNVAADELLEGLLAEGVRVLRVGRSASVRESLRGATLDARLERCESVVAAREKLRAVQNSGQGGGGGGSAVSEAFQEVRRAESAASLRLMKEADAVVTSCIGSGGIADLIANEATASSSRGPLLRFSSVLIDEATQSTEPASLVPLLMGAQQLFLVGDSQQLPPTVTDLTASRQGLATSLFERLQASGLQPSLLDTQYRMHPALAEFSSKRFYNGRLKSAVDPIDRPPPLGLQWPNPNCPIAHVSVEGPERRAASELGASEGTSYSNPAEAKAVATLVRAALSAGPDDLKEADIGIITPYNAQALLLRRELGIEDADEQADAAQQGKGGIEVASVDGFQGREKELIIFSPVRSNPERRIGFVADHRRLNVAITRARRGLVIVGDDATLSSDQTWRDLFAFLRRKKCIVPAAEDLG